jgi:hypothetical protein
MTLSAHQPAYLPWLGFFQKMARADIFVILDDVQFERNSFINRNRIKVNDKPHWLTIPLQMAGHMGKTIRQMEIDNSTDWRRKHWETIRHNYCKAPFFKEYEGFIKGFIDSIGSVSWRWITEWLPFFPTKNCYHQLGIGVHGEKQELVLNLCRHFGADQFLFGALGRDYVDVEYFRANGVEPLFQDFKCPEYPQLGTKLVPDGWFQSFKEFAFPLWVKERWPVRRYRKGFIPNLSVIDSLFCVGIEGTKALISGR